MISEEHLYAIALRECSQIGDINFLKLVRAFGSAKNAWENAKKGHQPIEGISRKTVMDIGNPEYLKFAEKELKFCEKNNVRIKLRHLNDLPFLLNECDDAPAILYQKGHFDHSIKTISLIGTRNITSYGRQFITDFFEETGNCHYISISGLALGADKEVHERSIQYKIPTVAVLAHGFHTLYPSKNKKLAEKILAEGGALITEFNSSRKPDRENFIQRNRIIAGISPSTIVVETGFGGGSISTATFANQYNRDVFALPGKITDQYSQGCNQLILQNKATAISTLKDLIDYLGFSIPSVKPGDLFPSSETHTQLSENQKIIYQSITCHPKISIDGLADKTDFSSHQILAIILELELLGKVKSFSGRQFISI
ncbi:DNA processing protein [Chryseobacterium defluvii]|uniref:DNA processing protein n=1 Tax=Chryseobacterium defluvii TaxID=160396 RepID=A0A840KBK8_9FLAO|nr:DNA-processing protein DprA [Chryseobacterium defluvii]MBB4806801.1 DNA processing protein [Chryseobacterium defluvii]